MVGKIADADADDIFSSRFTSVVCICRRKGGGTSVDREKRVVRVDWRGSVVVRTPFLLAKKNFAKSIPLVSEAGVLLSSQTNKSEEGVETCSSLKALNMKPYTEYFKGSFCSFGYSMSGLKNRSQ